MFFKALVLLTHSRSPHSSFRGITAYVRISGDEPIIQNEALTQLASTRFRSTFEQFVDHGVEVHESCVFAKIVVRFAQEGVPASVAALENDFLRSLERGHYVDLILDA